MSQFNRRDFVFLSSGAAVGSMVVSGAATAAVADDSHGINFSKSGLVTGKPKPLKHKSIPGFLSEQQIAPHHTAHYGGALRGYSAADAKVEASIKAGETLDGSAYGALKRTISTKGNSVVLHEMYFDGMAPVAPDPAAAVRAAIDVSRELEYDGREHDRERYSRRMIERIMTQYDDLGVEFESDDLNYLLTKMSQLPSDIIEDADAA